MFQDPFRQFEVHRDHEESVNKMHARSSGTGLLVHFSDWATDGMAQEFWFTVPSEAVEMFILKLLNPVLLINLFYFTKPTKCTHNMHSSTG